MSGTQFDSTLRIALWLVHGKKCLYCGEQIQFRELEIDHIVPQSLRNKDEELRDLKVRLGIPLTFDLDAPGNLLPTHSWCNSSKSGRVFQVPRAIFLLEIAGSKAEAVETARSSVDLRIRKEQLLASLKAALEKGNVGAADILGTVSGVDRFPSMPPLQFADGEWDGHDLGTAIEELLDKPVLFGAPDIDFIEFVDAAGGTMKISTCRDYRRAKATGFYAPTTFAMKMEAFVERIDAVLAAVASAKVPLISNVSSPQVGVADLHLLPTTVLPWLGPDDGLINALGDVSLRELVLSGTVSLLDVSTYRIEFHFQGCGALISELLRADFDGDGMEEILVQYYLYAIGGSLGVSHIGVLKRYDPNSRFVYSRFQS